MQDWYRAQLDCMGYWGIDGDDLGPSVLKIGGGLSTGREGTFFALQRREIGCEDSELFRIDTFYLYVFIDI